MFEHSGIDYDGTKPGSTMETNSLSKVDLIAAALTRLSTRWDQAVGRASTNIPRVVSGIHDETVVQYTARMPAEDRRMLGMWFTDRYNYLQAEYANAINEADNIIGKQWLFDQRPKMAKSQDG